MVVWQVALMWENQNIVGQKIMRIFGGLLQAKTHANRIYFSWCCCRVLLKQKKNRQVGGTRSCRDTVFLRNRRLGTKQYWSRSLMEKSEAPNKTERAHGSRRMKSSRNLWGALKGKRVIGYFDGIVNSLCRSVNEIILRNNGGLSCTVEDARFHQRRIRNNSQMTARIFSH